MKGFISKKQTFIMNKLVGKKRVLHVGCTNSPNHILRWEKNSLLHPKISQEVENAGGSVVGIDIDSEAVNWLRQKMPKTDLRVIDACHMQQEFSDEFDLIIAGDIIEHLSNPGIFLEACGRVLSNSGEIIITTTNAFSIIRFAKALLFHEAVHSEHTAYFSHKTLSRLFEMANLTTTTAGYYRSEPLAFGLSMNRVISNTLEYVTCIGWPQFAEGVIVCGRK